MTGALEAGAAAIVVGDVWLLALSWRHPVVLGGVLGAVGIPLAAFAIASGPSVTRGGGALLLALALLIIGVGVYGLGRALERVLVDGPDDGAKR